MQVILILKLSFLQDEAESEGTILDAPYEYLTDSGKAIGTVEIIKTTPDEMVQGRPLAQDENKVLVKKVYPQGSKEDEEFVERAFLIVNKGTASSQSPKEFH